MTARATATRAPAEQPPVLLSLDQVAVDSLFMGIKETPTLCHLEHIATALRPYVTGTPATYPALDRMLANDLAKARWPQGDA